MDRKVVFVTGAGMGVGYGIALEFAKAGYDVAIHHSPSSGEGAKELCRRMEGYGAKTLAMEGDLSESGVIGRLCQRVDEEFGRMDVYVNNAGITAGGPVAEADEAQFDKVFAVNFKACYFGFKSAARIMIKHGTEGCILAILSNTMRLHTGLSSLYTTTKRAMERLVEVSAVELAPFGIRVNGIAPGWVDTGAARLGEKEPTLYQIPMKRWIPLEEMGQVALFLCGPYTKSIDGHVLLMDGGAVAAQGMGRSNLSGDFIRKMEEKREEIRRGQ